MYQIESMRHIWEKYEKHLNQGNQYEAGHRLTMSYKCETMLLIDDEDLH
jgi:hypothetical protein